MTAWKFSTPYGADAAEYTLEQLKSQGLINVHDAAVVSWTEGREEAPNPPRHYPRRLRRITRVLLGTVFGVIFFVPILGMAVGAAVGSCRAHCRMPGIDKAFIESVRSKVTPGTSALFALTSDAVDREGR